MMETTTLNTTEAPVKWWAAQDAHMRSLANSTHYSDETKLRVERMKVCLEFAYQANVYIAYGKRGISLKVNKPIVKNQKLVDNLEQVWNEEGVEKKMSPQGIIYRVKV